MYVLLKLWQKLADKFNTNFHSESMIRYELRTNITHCIYKHDWNVVILKRKMKKMYYILCIMYTHAYIILYTYVCTSLDNNESYLMTHVWVGWSKRCIRKKISWKSRSRISPQTVANINGAEASSAGFFNISSFVHVLFYSLSS